MISTSYFSQSVEEPRTLKPSISWGCRRRANLGLVCVLFCTLCYLYSLVMMYCGAFVLFGLVFCVFLQCFDTVGWVIWPIKTRPPYDLYCVGGTLSLTQSINQFLQQNLYRQEVWDIDSLKCVLLHCWIRQTKQQWCSGYLTDVLNSCCANDVHNLTLIVNFEWLCAIVWRHA